MTVNIMNDDPEYLISNLLMPAKERYIPDGPKRFIFTSYSFGSVASRNGPAIVDEAIAYIREISDANGRTPVKWSDLLE